MIPGTYSSWIPYGKGMESSWKRYGIHMEKVWKRYGIHVEKPWNPSTIPWNPSTKSMESIPHSMESIPPFHGIHPPFHGIHLEFLQSIPPSMDSTWNNPGRVKYWVIPNNNFRQYAKTNVREFIEYGQTFASGY